jgi:uncharacterized membrane protein YkvA (DUF1232 family)
MTASADRFDPQGPLDPSRALVPATVKLNTETVKRGFWPKLKRVAAHIPFAEELVALWFAATDKQTPATGKAIMLAALAYFVMPVDALPDWLPGIGFTDDAAVIAAAIAMAGRMIKPAHREAARDLLERMAEG